MIDNIVLRTAIVEFIDIVQRWEDPDVEILVEALWILALAGVKHSGVPLDQTRNVLDLMAELAKQEVTPAIARVKLKEWQL